MILNHIKTAFGLTGGDVRERDEWGFLPFWICLRGQVAMQHQHCCKKPAQHPLGQGQVQASTGSGTLVNLLRDSSAHVFLTEEDS